MATSLTPRKRRSFSARIRVAFLSLGLLAIGLTGVEAFRIADAALEEATYERLTGIRESKKRQIESYLKDILRITAALARDQSTVDALLGFQTAWLDLETAARSQASLPSRDALEDFYGERLLPALRQSLHAPASLDGLWPNSPAGVLLQQRYLAEREPPIAGDYAAVHRIHHETFVGYAATFDLEDLLLIDAASEAVLYSVHKGPDLGISLRQQPYSDSALARAFRAATKSGGGAAVADFAPYAGAFGAPASFAAAPVQAGGETLGALAVRLSARKIDEVMTGGGAWREEGLGETGETYLVGPDRLMRSDSRFEIEDPAEYLEQLRRQGYSEETLERIRRHGTSILAQSVRTAAVDRAFEGEAATAQVVDYRGVPVLSSFTPLDLPGLEWVLLSEIDVREALAPVRSLRNRLFGLALVVSVLFVAAGYVFSRRTTRPLLQLTDQIERLGQSNLEEPHELEPLDDADDEVARLSQTFQDLTRRLRATLISRDALDNLLRSMINAVIVLRDTTRTSRRADPPVTIVSANPAACRLLGYEEGELIGRPIREILGSGLDEPEWLIELRRSGRIPAVEKQLRTRDGRHIDTLFTAAFLRADSGPSPDVVCVAQDITERKLAEQRLRASRAELQKLTAQLLTAQEQERRRLARELHDDITQRVGMLAIGAGKLAREAAASPLRDGLEQLKEESIQLSHDVQRLSRSLHPAMLDDLGLVAALKSECEALRRRVGLPVSFAAEELPADFSSEVALGLYRITQESFRNIVRHAQASEVDVELSLHDGLVRLTIEDNGVGFRLEDGRSRTGLGLASMDERARLLGGRLEVQSTPGKGTRILVEAPWQRSQA